ncbi:MAG: hypothetical protein ACI3YK_06495 [Eubacteriales bacterium]
MLKALFKKQLMEVNAWLIRDKKSGKRRSTTGMVLMILLYAAIFIGLGAVFFFVGTMLCGPLVSVGLGWLYFALMGLISVLLGVFGSVFNTYATLYLAKDNAFLLSMPIPPGMILMVRLFGVWMWGLIYESIVFIPALIVYWITALFNGISGVFTVFSGIILLFLLSLFVLTLTCVLGWVVAKISSRLKNKSFVVVLASLIFLAAYYYVYMRAYEMLQNVLAYADVVGEKIRGAAYPIYLMGRAGEGNLLSLFLFALIVVALFALTYFVLSHSFLKMATANRGTAKKTFKEKAVKGREVSGALFFKERSRFLSSPTYMLNCGLGTLFLIVMGVVMLFKGGWVRDLMSGMGAAELTPLFACAALCMLTAMNDITAPSVSLEGKNLWLVQSYPVSAWQVLLAKLKLHLLITEIPTLFCGICMVIALRPGIYFGVMMVVLPMLFVLLSASFGLTINLKTPNLKWTDETVPVKQSIGVMLTLFGGWLIVLAFGGLYVLLRAFLIPELYLLCVAVVLAAASAALLFWLKTKGARIFATL